MGTPIQAKLTLGQPDDKYEQEADRNAVEVDNQINLSLSKDIRPEENLIARNSTLQISRLPEQMKSNSESSVRGERATTFDLDASIRNAKGQGQPLIEEVREPMEQMFGKDFSQVRVHADTQSDELNQSIQARAFTTGQDIFFRQGMYAPRSRTGQKLIAHELTHVVQQNGDLVQRAPQEEGSTQKVESGALNEDLSDEDIHLSPEELEQLFAAGKDIDELYQIRLITHS